MFKRSVSKRGESKRSLFYPMLLLCALLTVPLPAFAAALLTISSPAADGVFVVTGSGLQGVSGMHLLITYDSTTLSKPRSITAGPLVSGMMFAPNPANPIQIAIIGTAGISSNGFGTIATIKFDRTGSSPGSITAFQLQDLLDAHSHKVTSATRIDNPTAAVADAGLKVIDTTDTISHPVTPGTPGGDTPTSDTTRTTPPTYQVGGTLTLPPTEMVTGNEKKEAATQAAQQETPEVAARETVTTNAEVGEPAAKAATPKAPAAQPAAASKPVQSVIERFRLYQGEMTAKKLIALFERDGAAPFTQSPAIAIADGNATVILVISKVSGDTAPNFAFNHARFVLLTRIGDGEWEVEVTPEKGVVRASVTMLSDGNMQELPLTVTPKSELVLNQSGQQSEADFALFLKDRGTPAAPKYDLNGDGKRDYVDDYIFTANYLFKMAQKSNTKKSAGQKPQ